MSQGHYRMHLREASLFASLGKGPIMRFLGIGEWNDLGSLYLQLMAEGHEVKVYVEKKEAHDVLEGLIHRVEDWKIEL